MATGEKYFGDLKSVDGELNVVILISLDILKIKQLSETIGDKKNI